ncbi:DUF4123 domain-containing protein [Providencia hangzhouensis]
MSHEGRARGGGKWLNLKRAMPLSMQLPSPMSLICSPEHEPPASCLYSEPIQPEIVSLAPYLVEVTEEVQRWLSTRETPWEIYVYTHATMRELRQHLRKYLMVMIPGQEKPVFWRFYDPRNVWDVLEPLIIGDCMYF